MKKLTITAIINRLTDEDLNSLDKKLIEKIGKGRAVKYKIVGVE